MHDDINLQQELLLCRKQRKKMQNHMHQNMCVEHPNRMLANGPNHPGPGPGPEEIPMVDVSLFACDFLFFKCMLSLMKAST